MADYLRDEFIKNVRISESTLRQLSDVFEERLTLLRDELNKGNETKDPHVAFLTYIVRFDNKGYRVWSIDEVIRYFRAASVVERVVFSLESNQSLTTARRLGAYLELTLDGFDESKNVLVSSSDSREWAESSFSSVAEILFKHKTRSWLARSWWAGFMLQLIGIGAGFGVSLWVAIRNAPLLKIESALLLVFLFSLLVCSAIWGQVHVAVLNQLHRLFPNTEFLRDSSPRWLIQGLVTTAVGALLLWALNLLAGWIYTAASPYFAG